MITKNHDAGMQQGLVLSVDNAERTVTVRFATTVPIYPGEEVVLAWPKVKKVNQKQLSVPEM